MKLKESKFCCAFAWNPRDTATNSILLAAGSIDGVMDDNFSSEAHLEIRRVDLSDTTSTELPVVGRVVMPDRAHRIHWTSHGGQLGTIAAGLTDGTVKVWSADRMLETYDGSADVASATNDDPFGVNSTPSAHTDKPSADPEAATLCTIPAHQGGVKGLHFNPVKRELLATGGADRELAIWSLVNPSEPTRITAIPKATHVAEITDIRWHVQVERILGTTTSMGTFSLWDLRIGKQTQQIQGQQGAATTLAWHPLGLTEVAIARDGSNPVVQIWDLKKANAPVKELRGHTAGITGLGWCPDDSNLLFSSACDGRTICWNPTSGELVGELTRQQNWVTDVAWCPRVPAIVATSSFDNSLAVHAAQDVSGTNATGTATLPKAVPKWLVRPCSASFGFGGRIVRLSKDGNQTLEVLTKTSEPPKADSEFRQQFDTQRADPEWISAQGHADMAAVAKSNIAGNREAVLGYLGVPPAEVLEAVQTAADGFGGDEKEVDELLARSIACGRLTEAVNLCISANRYDDAFATAYLQGTAEVTRVHQAYLQHKATTARFATYLSAVSTKDLTGLKAAVSEKKAPWREALAVLASFLAPQQFAAAANELGSALEVANAEAAASCYICAGSVDAVARLWSKLKPTAAFIHSTQIFESVTKTQCRDKTFIDALASYADQLAKAGDYKGALSYAARAADLGSLEGAVVADLCQSMVAPADRLNIRFPFTPIQIPETNIPFVRQIAAMQQPVQRRVDPQPTQQQHQGGGVQQQQRFGAPQHPNAGMATNQQNYHQHPGMQAQNQGTFQQNQSSFQQQNQNQANHPQQQQFNNNATNQGNMPPVNRAPAPMPMPNNGGHPGQFSSPNATNQMPMPPANNNINNGQFTNQGLPPPQQGGMYGGNIAGHPNMPPPMNNNMPPPPNTNNFGVNGALPRSGTPSAPISGTPTGFAPPPQSSQFNNGPRTASVGPPPPAGGAPVASMPPPPATPPAAASMLAKGPASPYGNPPPPSTQPPTTAGPQVHHQPPTNTAPAMPAATTAPVNPQPQPTPQPAPSAFAPSAYTAGPASPLTAQQQRLAASGSSTVIFTYPVDSIQSGEGQQIASAIVAATNRVVDKRKRDSIEKAALELLGRLTKGEVSAPCVQLLLGFVATLGSPASKDAWRKLSDSHFSEIGPYLNLKFL